MLLLYLVLAMVVALVGGALPAVVAVIGGFLLANWFFTPPYYQFTIAEGENLLALLVYVFAAGTVAVLVDRVGRSRVRAARSQAEAEALVVARRRPGPAGVGGRDARPAAHHVRGPGGRPAPARRLVVAAARQRR